MEGGGIVPRIAFNDLLQLKGIEHLSAEERGGFFKLCEFCLQGKTLPDDAERLSRASGIHPSRFMSFWQAVAHLFDFDEKRGGFVLPFIEEKRDAEAHRRRIQSQAGARGAASRWQEKGHPKGRAKGQGIGHPIGQPIPANRINDLSPQAAPGDLTGKETNKTKVKSSSGEKRGTLCPESFPLDESLRAWFAERIGAGINLELETEHFLAHHRAKGTRFKDWREAWRKWMINALKYAKRDGLLESPLSASAEPEESADEIRRQIEEAKRMRRAEENEKA